MKQAESDAKDEVKGRALGICEVCGLLAGHDYQHRKNRCHCTADERWDVRNGLYVCGFGNLTGCHGIIHQNPRLAVVYGWTVPANMDPASRRVCRRGEWVLLGLPAQVIPIPREDYDKHDIPNDTTSMFVANIRARLGGVR